jgi:hypothetical protein
MVDTSRGEFLSITTWDFSIKFSTALYVRLATNILVELAFVPSIVFIKYRDFSLSSMFEHEIKNKDKAMQLTSVR